MNYEGPVYCRSIVEELYANAEYLLTRKEKPQVIIGSIRTITSLRNRFVTSGNTDTTQTIDALLASMLFLHPNQEEDKKEVHDFLLQLIEKEEIPTTPIFYDSFLDILRFHPIPLFNYMETLLADGAAVMGSGDEDIIVQYSVAKTYPLHWLHGLIQWDIGDAMVYKDIRKELVYELFPHGRQRNLSGSTYFAECLATRKIRSLLYSYQLTRMHLCLEEIEKAAVQVTTATVQNLAIKRSALASSHKKVLSTFLKKAEEDGPQEFLRYIKEKINEAYQTKRNVFSLL